MQRIALIKAEPANLLEQESPRFHGFYFQLYREQTNSGKNLFHGYCPDFEITETTDRSNQENAVFELVSRLLESISRHLIALIENGQLDQVYEHVDYSVYGLSPERTKEVEAEFDENRIYFDVRIARVYKPRLSDLILPQARKRAQFGPFQTRTIAS